MLPGLVGTSGAGWATGGALAPADGFETRLSLAFALSSSSATTWFVKLDGIALGWFPTTAMACCMESGPPEFCDLGHSSCFSSQAFQLSQGCSLEAVPAAPSPSTSGMRDSWEPGPSCSFRAASATSSCLVAWARHSCAAASTASPAICSTSCAMICILDTSCSWSSNCSSRMVLRFSIMGCTRLRTVALAFPTRASSRFSTIVGMTSRFFTTWLAFASSHCDGLFSPVSVEDVESPFRDVPRTSWALAGPPQSLPRTRLLIAATSVCTWSMTWLATFCMSSPILLGISSSSAMAVEMRESLAQASDICFAEASIFDFSSFRLVPSIREPWNWSFVWCTRVQYRFSSPG
mmetsp:Transcript_5058/g.13330  ORF Transcript_5058/g.13330 Transcript_5058/m.13330 type:complete len:349 (-) Transcript_5058:338-1384(-)